MKKKTIIGLITIFFIIAFSAIWLPYQFETMTIRHQFGHNFTALNNVRVGLRLYKSDHGNYPKNLEELNGRYLNGFLNGEIQTPLYYREGWRHGSDHPVKSGIKNVSSVSLDDSESGNM